MKATLIRLAPWVLLGAALATFGLAGALAGAALLGLAETLQFFRDHTAISAANAMALARRTGEAEAMAARLGEIEKQLKEALTPERLRMAQELLRSRIPTLPKGY